ncbi:MAG: hypothetical protein Ta2E_02540 [Mycoplasmoidaceae bacterium]|nr:MAG: hypothetical protein Ta2E_02540 [Mycoplasmoidaceae bacterium]
MSMVGNSLDNIPSEYANGRIKLECINKLKPHARTMDNILWVLQNNVRIQSCLEDMSPVEYRNKYLIFLRLGYNSINSCSVL